MSEASDRVRAAAEDARSGDDMVSEPTMFGPGLGEEPLDSPLDKDTLDEQASTQMGGWESRRRKAN
jgi:hypothetical protein